MQVVKKQWYCVEVASVALVLCLLSTVAQAHDCPPNWTPPSNTPGPGVGGANWVVNSPPGYGAAKGTFARLDLLWANPQTGKAGSKPTFYLGATGGGIEVDAGAQYESHAQAGFDAGWTVFMSVAAHGCSRWQQKAFTGGLGNIPAEFKLDPNGTAVLTMGSNALTTNWGLVPGASLNKGGTRMKRVIGITQTILTSGDFVRDGSYFLGTQFSAGGVASYTTDNTGKPIISSTYTNHWPTTGSTSIYKPNSASGKNAGGLRIVNMRSPWQRSEPSGQVQEPDAHNPNRFTQEEVDIDFRSKAQIAKMSKRSGNKNKKNH